MKWLTLEEIKQQLRIEPDFTDEDTLLERYGNSAELYVLNVTGRTYDELKAMNPTGEDEFPADLWEATIMLVQISYNRDTPISRQNMYIVPWGVDAKIKPYMRLAGFDDMAEVQVVTLGSDVKIAFTVDLPDGLKLSDIDFTGKVVNSMDSGKVMNFVKADCIEIEDGKSYVVLVDTDVMGVGSYLLRVTVFVPDTDYPSGYRKEVVNINPHISVKG